MSSDSIIKMFGCSKHGCTNNSKKGFGLFILPSIKTNSGSGRRECWLKRMGRQAQIASVYEVLMLRKY